MSCTDGFTGTVAAPRRNHFFYGKMMGVEQFDIEQRYAIGQRWLMNRLALGTGIVCGLAAARTADGKRVVLKPGLAVDGLGREIVVPGAVEYDPLAAPDPCGCSGAAGATAPGRYQLCLRYRECGADQQPVPYAEDCDAAACEPGTTVETYALGLRGVVDPPPPAFACDGWLAPLSGGTSPPPPAIADLQARLAAMLKAACPAPPADGCVVLGTVLIGGSAGALTLDEVLPQERSYLYSQAQIVDMVLCLAATVASCCGPGGGGTVEPPPPGDTLRLTGIDFVQLSGAPPAFTVVQSVTALTPVPQIPATSAGGGLGSTVDHGPSPVTLLRLTFSGPLEGSTALAAMGGRGIAVVETGAGVAVKAAAMMLDSNVLILSLPSSPGTYQVTLWGSDATDHQAIRSWNADPGKRRALDGEPGANPNPLLPSGDGTDGGDFTFTFQIV